MTPIISRADLDAESEALCFKLAKPDRDSKIGPDLWHPVGRGDRDNGMAHEAKQVCRTPCPVRMACLRAGLERPDHDPGIWGGFDLGDPADRKAAQKWAGVTTPQPALLPPHECGTYAGWQVHLKRKEAPCADCRTVRNQYEADRKRRLRAKKGAA